MQQSLLADRFKLKVHFETREMPIYKLVVAKGGPKLTPAKEPTPSPGNRLRPEDARGVRVRPKTPAGSEMTVKGETLDIWEDMPILGLGRPVVNETGLTGRYDFTLNWEPDQATSVGPKVLAAPGESDLPNLFTALQEQLGLKLVPTKGPVKVIIIDHIELPSEN